MVRHTFILVGILMGLLQSPAIAGKLNGQSGGKKEQIIKHISKLRGARLDKLLKHLGKQNSDDVFNCLCHATGRGGVGGGEYYKPGAPCMATGVLGGHIGPFGFPDDPDTWKRCTYGGKKTIVDVIEKALDSKLAEGTVPLEPKMSKAKISKLENEFFERNLAYKNACLPSQQKITDSPLFALKIAREAGNLCEQAVAVDLFLSSRKAASNAGIALELLGINILKNEYDFAGYTNDVAARASQKYATSIMKKVLGKAFGAASSIKNLYDVGELYKREEHLRRTDVYFSEASDLFHKSRKWSTKKIADKEIEIERDIIQAREKIIEVEDFYERQRSFALNEAASAAGGGGGKLDLYFMENPAIKQKYDAKEEKQRKAANDKKTELLYQIENLMLKQRIMKDYREPFSTEGCKKYLAKREEACKKRLAEEARLAKERAMRERSTERRLQHPISGGGSISGVDLTRPKTGRTRPNPLGGIPGPVVKPQR